MKNGDKQLKKAFLKEKVIKSIKSGHPWCFSGGIQKVEDGILDGDLCEVYSNKEFLGIGYFNSKSDIRIRILSRVRETINTDFFIKRFKVLKEHKESYISNTNAYRLVFGESDNLPGLIVDIYNNVAILQIHTNGIEKLKNNIKEALIKVLNPLMIYEKSDIRVRMNEGLPQQAHSLLYGNMIEDVEIIENNFKFIINVIKGQKTGFFLDQRMNRLSLIQYTKDKTVLNCFSYTGGFSVYAQFNAKSVTSVDISKEAMEYAKKNFMLNNFKVEENKFIVSDVFDYLKKIRNYEYDLIILDPPSFAKNKKQVKNAIKAYTTINSKALEKLPDYGILVTSSCTTHINELTFIKILHQSSVNTNCQLKVLESRIQPLDHPYNLNFPEGRYLKFFILQKYPVW